jgi:hypothetical protein
MRHIFDVNVPIYLQCKYGVIESLTIEGAMSGQVAKMVRCFCPTHCVDFAEGHMGYEDDDRVSVDRWYC